MTSSTYTPQTNRAEYNNIQSNLKVICYLQNNSHSLEPGALKRFLETAIKEGYNNLTVTGHDPFNYSELKELLKFTNEAGYFNAVTTHDGFPGIERNKKIMQYINLVVMNLDGKKEEYNYIRKNPEAFGQILEILDMLKTHQTQIGFSHRLHNEPIDTLKWLCDLAKEIKATLVHLLPVEKDDHENTSLDTLKHSDELRLKFFVLYHFYKLKHQDDFELKLDLLHRNIVMQYPQLAFQFVCEDICDSNFYREITIDEEGYVLPVAHGFTRTLALGNIYENISLTEMMKRYHDDKLGQLKNIYLKVYQNIVDNPNHLLFNYPEMVINESMRMVKVMNYNYGVC